MIKTNKIDRKSPAPKYILLILLPIHVFRFHHWTWKRYTLCIFLNLIHAGNKLHQPSSKNIVPIESNASLRIIQLNMKNTTTVYRHKQNKNTNINGSDFEKLHQIIPHVRFLMILLLFCYNYNLWNIAWHFSFFFFFLIIKELI